MKFVLMNQNFITSHIVGFLLFVDQNNTMNTNNAVLALKDPRVIKKTLSFISFIPVQNYEYEEKIR